MLLKNKIAVVTGASKGMGKAIALEFAKEGAQVCLVSRSKESLEETVKEIQEQTDREVFFVAGDVKDPQLSNRVYDEVINKWGSCHILVNNAGGPVMGSFLDHSHEVWAETLQQNLLSVIRFTKQFAVKMKEQQWGRIINISSTLAKEPTAQMVLSATARAGVSAFSKAISNELAEYNVTINTICPGGVLTDRLVNLVSELAVKNGVEYEEQLVQNGSQIPMKRLATPKEIADFAVCLASEKASYVTGQSIMVDGGLTRSYF